MVNIKSSISKIECLLERDSEDCSTYAALEARLAIERICYDRLRIAHDYIPHEEIKKWQPRDIVKAIMQEANPHVAETFTMSISKNTRPKDAPPPTREEYESMEFIPVGTQVGFNPNKLGQLWNALSNLALHIRIPVNDKDEVTRYGSAEKIRAKVIEALEEIKRIEKGTMIAGGIGDEISFKCTCGFKNKRKIDLLQDKQIINCINPRCDESYNYLAKCTTFARRSIDIICRNCGEKRDLLKKAIEKLPTDQRIEFDCDGCGEAIIINWNLMQGQNTPEK